MVDGDSVNLGKQKWRLLGINTPEYNKPLADNAKALLQKILQRSKTVYWLQGEEPADRYGRQLGYLFNEAGQFVAQPLLREGLAFAVVVAPNVAYVACIEQSQQQAKQKQQGVWHHRYFAPIEAGSASRTGFVRWRGKIKAVDFTKAGVWLEFEGAKGALQLPQKAQAYFTKAYLASLEGKTIEATGWAVKRRPKKGFAPMVMRVYHPLHITVLVQ